MKMDRLARGSILSLLSIINIFVGVGELMKSFVQL